MADARCQMEVAEWVRTHYLPCQFGQPFHRRKMRLAPGGEAQFDAVSENGLVVACISTSGARTASGKLAVGKLTKIRADMLFLMLACPVRPLVVLTERDMYERCLAEKQAGRTPQAVEFVYAELPEELEERLRRSRQVASQEVTPLSAGALFAD